MDFLANCITLDELCEEDKGEEKNEKEEKEKEEYNDEGTNTRSDSARFTSIVCVTADALRPKDAF